MLCTHPSVNCINPYEIVRKYRCNSCGEVMMCACEEDFSRRFFAHQLSYAREPGSRLRIPVTVGFQAAVCNNCRGLPEQAYPKGEMYRRDSKILRYYWREILFKTTRLFGEWAREHGYDNWLLARRKHRREYGYIEKQVIAEIKELHRRSPKYVYHEESQHSVLTKSRVEALNLAAVYVKREGSGVAITDGNNTYSAEEFVAAHFKRLGYDSMFTESRPFHALFGVFLWLLIQDPEDTNNEVVGFGDRLAFERGVKGEMIWTSLPKDFGTPGYRVRRGAAIEKYFDTMLAVDKDDLLWTFDYWIEPSTALRQYLWAHRPEDVAKAREIVSILPTGVVLRILRYLLADYWKRYLGWPDLLVHNTGEFFFVEVKLSKDKLSEVQKNWIYGNTNELHLPFKFVKIHKRNREAESSQSRVCFT